METRASSEGIFFGFVLWVTIDCNQEKMQATVNEILKEYEERGEYVPVYTAPSFVSQPAGGSSTAPVRPTMPMPPRIIFPQ